MITFIELIALLTFIGMGAYIIYLQQQLKDMRRIKVKYTKLGRQKAWGMAHSEGLVELDERIKGKKHQAQV